MQPEVIGHIIEVVKVLHVDDDPNQFEFIKYFLNQIDPVLEFHCVQTPEEVFYELENQNYDCLVTDFQMPEMNGIQLSKKVREKYDLPIILYTAHGSEEVAEAAFTTGIDDYLKKEMDPSHYQVLAKRIRTVVEKAQTKKLYQTVVEQTRDALCIFVEKKLVFANKSAIDLFNEEKSGRIIRKSSLRKILNENDIFEPGFHEFKYLDANNDEYIYEVSSSPLLYSGKDAILCFFRDITEKRKIELEKKISQKRFRSLVEVSPDGIATFNSFGYMTFLNEAFSTLTGFASEELLGQHLTKLKTLRKRDLLTYLGVFTTVIRGNISPPQQGIYNRKDGTNGIVEGHLGLIDVADKKEMLLIAKDITERKKQEIRLKLLFDNNSEGLIEIDSDGTVVDINEAAVNILRLETKKIQGSNINDILPPHAGLQRQLKEEILNVKEYKKNRSFKCKFELDRSNVLLDVKLYPVLMNNVIFGIQLVIRDLSKIVETQVQESPIEAPIDVIEDSNYPIIDPNISS